MSFSLKGCVLAVVALVSATAASATQFVVNGDFSQVQNGLTASRQMSTGDGATQYVTGWTNGQVSGDTSGYSFLVMGNQGTQVDGITANGGGKLYFWSKYSDQANAQSNGYTLSSAVGGSGGNYLASDGAYQTALIYQSLSGLTVGQSYTLTFNWAGAQQHGYSGATTDNWTVYFGTSNSYQQQTTSTVNVVDHGFSGWQKASMVFTAQASTQILAFMAHGTPEGQPPFSLLDDVSLTESAVPEPAAWAMMITGFGLIGTMLRRRREATLTA